MKLSPRERLAVGVSAAAAGLGVAGIIGAVVLATDGHSSPAKPVQVQQVAATSEVSTTAPAPTHHATTKAAAKTTAAPTSAAPVTSAAPKIQRAAVDPTTEPAPPTTTGATPTVPGPGFTSGQTPAWADTCAPGPNGGWQCWNTPAAHHATASP